METVGDYLKKEREAKNISLRKVSRLTKISEHYLEYLEKDDYEKLPQGPYITGYISSYARLIGGNADEALKLYASRREKTDDAEELSPKKSKDNGKQGAISSSIKKITLLKNKRENQHAHAQQEKPQENGRQASTTVLTEKMGASSHADGSSFRTIISSLLQSTAASINKSVSSLSRVTFSSKSISFSLKRTVTKLNILKWLFDKRTWLFGSLTLLISGILILAGFGFYHLFIYQKNPPVLADRHVLQNKGSQTTLAADTAENKALYLPRDASARSKDLSPMTSNPTKTVSSPTSGAKDSGTASPSLARTEDSAAAAPSSLVPSLSDRIAPTKTTSGPRHDTIRLDSPTPEALPGDLNLEVIKATVGSDVKDRMPAGVSNYFSWSTNRVYVWSLIQCKNPPSSIRHIYYFQGEKLSDVHLNVQSPRWRTWSYIPLSNKRYIGPWRIDITSAEGKVLRSLNFEVK
jgi:transcriptional regulator with XRE-family HTH domain